MFAAFRNARNGMRIPHFTKGPAIGLYIGVATIITINDHIIEVTGITGASMYPTLNPKYSETGTKDFVLFGKWRPTKDLKRGDVVLIGMPHKPEGLGIKRVVAMEGDWVTLNNKRMPKNPKQVPSPDAMVWDAVGEKREYGGKIRRHKIPVGHVWVEGDNVDASHDSNIYGPISKSLIQGKAIMCVWPLDRYGEKPWESYNGKTKVEQDPNFDVGEWND